MSNGVEVMPTDKEMQEYAASLPDIYRDILAAFPEIEPALWVGRSDANNVLLQQAPQPPFGRGASGMSRTR